jgi:tetratricopeptide (TPR) repeat protein
MTEDSPQPRTPAAQPTIAQQATGGPGSTINQAGRDIIVHPSAPPPRSVVTTALPRDTADFVGRDLELQRILDTAARGRVVSIHAIDGMPGVGKTALVVRAAHRLAGQFPDGRYLIDLHTHTPGQTPAEPAEVLARLLTDLGIDPRFLPDSLDARRDLWRDQMAGKKVLLVLDDARDHAQVEHLIPPGQDCLTLITSRRRLIALDGAVALALDVLPPGTAADLFIAMTRRDTTDADQAAVAGIVELCGFLPLAIVLLAGRLAHHPAWTVAGLAAEFAATQDRLGELEAGQRAVRAAFTMSYQDLPAGRQVLFRRLGLHPGTDLDHYAAAALAGIPLDTARREVEALYTDHLLEETTPGRYRLHDLLRAYARSLTTTNSAADTGGAVDRLLDYYQDTAATADRWLARRTRPAPRATPASSLVRDFGDEQDALGWMRRERANLLACLEYTSTHQPARMVALTGLLAGLLERDGPWPQARQLHQRAAVTARHLGDRLAHASALVNLGVVHQHTGGYGEAADVEQQALTIFRQIGDRVGEANTLVNLGLVRWATGAYGEAADLFRQALNIYQEIGDRVGEANALVNLGLVHQATGAYGEAADVEQQALIIYQEIGNRVGEANALNTLGLVRWATGGYGEAAVVEQQALVIYQEIGNRVGEANALNTLGLVRWATGAYGEAADLFRQALIIYREIGDRVGEANALDDLGLVHQATGGYGEAADVEQQALVIFREIGNRVGEANALDALGLVRWATGAYGEAADLFRQALIIYQEIGNRRGEASALGNLGLVRWATGAYGEAADLQQRALTIFREIGDRLGQAEVLNGIGSVLLATGAPDRALGMFTDALDLARDIGSPLKKARALEGTARSRAALGDIHTALTRLREAVEIYRHLGAPETDTAAAYLATLESG